MVIACLVLLGLVLPARAHAAPAEECARAYENAQEDRTAGHLQSAIRQLRVCVDARCPAFIRSDCGRWLDETELALPSVVFEPRRAGQATEQVSTSCDGRNVPHPFDGRAIKVDPGRRTFVFRTKGDDRTVTLELTAREGQHNRLIQVDLPEPISPAAVAPGATAMPAETIPPGARSAPATAPSLDRAEQRQSSPPSARRRRGAILPMAIGLAGLTGFAALAIAGHSQEESLSERCAPSCADSDVASVRLKYRLADISLGVGVVALVITAYLALSPPATGDNGNFAPRGGSAEARVSIEPRIFSNGAGVGAGATF